MLGTIGMRRWGDCPSALEAAVPESGREDMEARSLFIAFSTGQLQSLLIRSCLVSKIVFVVPDVAAIPLLDVAIADVKPIISRHVT